MIAWKTKGTQLYQALPEEMRQNWKACEPLSSIPNNRPSQESLYQTWNSIKETLSHKVCKLK
jgi:phenylacetic acid degradation protein/carnitine operon protein CaiE